MAMFCKTNGKECDGCGYCQEALPNCPICDEECEDIFVSNDGDILGCEHCIVKKDAADFLEMLKECV